MPKHAWPAVLKAAGWDIHTRKHFDDACHTASHSRHHFELLEEVIEVKLVLHHTLGQRFGFILLELGLCHLNQ